MERTNTNWSKTTRYIAGVGLALFGIFVLYLSRSVLPLLIIAGLIAVIVRPVILWLHNQICLPRVLAVVLVYLVLAVLVPLIIVLAMPAILDAGQFLQDLDYATIIQNVIVWLRSMVQSVKALPVPVEGLNLYIDRTADSILAALNHTTISEPEPVSIDSIFLSLGNALFTTVRTVADLVGALLSHIAVLLFTFLASVYISLSAHTFHTAFLRVVPERFQSETAVLIARIERAWSAFFRGQLILMLFIGVICWLGLAILGVPGAPYLGLVAGLLEIIPNIGPVIATIPAVIVALLKGSTYLPLSSITLALLVILFYFLVQQFENSLIVPKILGNAVDLPALVVIAGMWVGAEVGGLMGVLLATPLIATVWEIVRYVYRKILCENPFPPEEQAAAIRVAPPRKKRDWMQKLSHYWNRPSSKTAQPPDDQIG